MKIEKSGEIVFLKVGEELIRKMPCWMFHPGEGVTEKKQVNA